MSGTLRKIVACGLPARGRLATTAPPVAWGAKSLALSLCGPLGPRAYRLLAPSHQPVAPKPLIVMLHGCTQAPEDFAVGTGMNALAKEFGCLIAYPAQPSGANAQKCWNWFRPEDQGRSRGELALVAGLARDSQRGRPAYPGGNYIAGLLAGLCCSPDCCRRVSRCLCRGRCSFWPSCGLRASCRLSLRRNAQRNQSRAAQDRPSDDRLSRPSLHHSAFWQWHRNLGAGSARYAEPSSQNTARHRAGRSKLQCDHLLPRRRPHDGRAMADRRRR